MSDSDIGPHEFAEPTEDSPWGRKAGELHEHLNHWREFMVQPWSPIAITPEAINAILARPTIWLDDAIDLMAFGLGGCPLDPIERGARRAQACRAFCEASRDGKFALYGSRNAGSDDGQQIPHQYFDFPRRLSGREPSRALELDLSQVSDDRVFDDDHAGRRIKWFDVRVMPAGEFIAWLQMNAGASGGRDEAVSPTPTDFLAPDEGKSPTSRSLSASLRNAFPAGVPRDIPITSIREALSQDTVFKNRRLKLQKLKNGSYDTTLKRLLGRTTK